MKKKVLLISLFLVATVVASFQFSSEKENLQSLMLENIDALASDEWGGNSSLYWVRFCGLSDC